MKKNAFTLIELLIVIAIISLLAAIVFPVLATMVRRSIKAETQTIEAQKAAIKLPTPEIVPVGPGSSNVLSVSNLTSQANK